MDSIPTLAPGDESETALKALLIPWLKKFQKLGKEKFKVHGETRQRKGYPFSNYIHWLGGHFPRIIGQNGNIKLYEGQNQEKQNDYQKMVQNRLYNKRDAKASLNALRRLNKAKFFRRVYVKSGKFAKRFPGWWTGDQKRQAKQLRRSEIETQALQRKNNSVCSTDSMENEEMKRILKRKGITIRARKRVTIENAFRCQEVLESQNSPD